ncbi:uncharacterized protein LOC131318927 isoform X2 [Rhododendron vialii]|uniref:uncharacterized protein LOC131318927 isoform X2 n=1 Tax=Rhododendron vialii TaxID=182163 RepID=UPI00265DB7B4|nr:uncharacterized protein LOC131318927 isoform X2 [Rhododendron vialii]
MASPSNINTSSPTEKYPCPTVFNVLDFVPKLLSERGYKKWKKLMEDFIEKRGLIGFIDGTAKEEIDNQDDYKAWKRSNNLVHGWILATLTEDIRLDMLGLETAQKLWTQLEKMFDPTSKFNTSSPSEKYPCPTEFNVLDFVPQLLSERDYDTWKKLMEDFIEKRGLIGFIHDTAKEDIANQDYYKAWKRSDNLVRGWLLATLTQDIRLSALGWETAKELWTQLEKMFDPTSSLWQYDEEEENRVTRYLPLHKAVVKGDWEEAMGIIQQDPAAVTAAITPLYQTALQVAIQTGGRTHFVRKLLEKMTRYDVVHLVDEIGWTALHWAAICGTIEEAEMLVNKNSILANVLDRYEYTPLHYAARYGRREMVLYLHGITGEDILLAERTGALYLRDLVSSELYDIALTFLVQKPELACVDPTQMKHGTPFEQLHRNGSFRSGNSFNFWQNLIYLGVSIKSESIANRHNGGGGRRREDIESPANCCISVRQRLHFMFWEVVEKLAIYFWNPNSHRLIFQEAILWRRERVFNLIYQMDVGAELIRIIPASKDRWLNNGLHLAALLGREQQINLKASAPAAVLQMQQELQWFTEVENLTPPVYREGRNADGMTPAEVFSNTHQDLIKEAEHWMKDTATSCTIVAALIAAMAFAAAITVPGGNNNDNGHPLLSKQKAFQIFGISDALALFSSITFVLMFLLILTSRYYFLYTLHSRLVIGLITLFVSILSTMVASGAILYLIFGENKAWILIPVVALASIPATLFGSLQFPLLVEMIQSTYGRGIFGKKSDRAPTG